MRYYLDTNILIFVLLQDSDSICGDVQHSQAISDKIPIISSDHKFKEYVSQGLEFIFNKR